MVGVKLRSVYFYATTLFLGAFLGGSGFSVAAENGDNKQPAAQPAMRPVKQPVTDEACNTALKAKPKSSARSAKTTTPKTDSGRSYSAAYQRLLAEKAVRGEENSSVNFTLYDFSNSDPEENLAVIHPFTVANAAEKTYAIFTHEPARPALDPVYRIKQTRVYPVLTGSSLANGRMVVGNEEALDALVQFVGSIARGDRSGKAPGFPGPAGTGKTELLYVIDAVQKNLEKTDPQFKQFSYRFKNLHTIPALKYMFRFDKDGNPNYPWIDPDMPRSPFTLLRADMKEKILAQTLPQIRKKWGMTISRGWSKTEPKSDAIIRAILGYTYPEIAEGAISVNDLTEDEYMNAIVDYVTIVPKSTISNKSEPQIIRAQTEDPNFESLFAKPNLLRQAFYSSGEFTDLAVDYTGQVFQQDGGLLMLDELYRNPPALLNNLLEVKQNRIVQTDYGLPVEIDVVPVWNSNDESIEKAKEDQALKASLDRDEPNPMRLLLAPKQIEATSFFQVGLTSFKQRALNETALSNFDFRKVYPAPDMTGKTETAYGRYALYYESEGTRILIAPLALNYMSWLASATRFETDGGKMMKFKSELNLVAQDPSLYTDAIERLKIVLGEREVNPAERNELYKISYLLEEGRNGITARDVEAWFKLAIAQAIRDGRGVLTPKIMDQAFEAALLSGKIKTSNSDIRAHWQNLRALVKEKILLPHLAKDVRLIVSGDGDKADRIYDQVEREFLELAANPGTDRVTPDDGSAAVIINQPRLNKIRQVYRQKFGREFNATFLLRNLQGARQGRALRDGQLLEAVREFLAEEEAMTNDTIDAFDGFYNQEGSDPGMVEKVGLVETRLAQYGYDKISFREAVAYASQMRAAKILKDSQRK